MVALQSTSSSRLTQISHFQLKIHFDKRYITLEEKVSFSYRQYYSYNTVSSLTIAAIGYDTVGQRKTVLNMSRCGQTSVMCLITFQGCCGEKFWLYNLDYWSFCSTVLVCDIQIIAEFSCVKRSTMGKKIQLSTKLRKFGYGISVLHLSVHSLGVRGGNHKCKPVERGVCYS